MARALAATSAALVGFTILVLSGAMNRIDNWGIDHVMPALDPRGGGGSGIVSNTGLWRPFPLDVVWWQKVLDTYNYPASALVSITLLIACCALLWRRGQRWPALVWAGAWFAVNAVEFAGKYVLHRPGVYWTDGAERIPVTPFDSSYPSGHTARSAVLAAMVAYVWPRIRWPVAIWLVFVPAGLVVSAAHTISDVIGGMLLGLLVVLTAHAMIARWDWTQLRRSWSSLTAKSSMNRSRSSPT